jgi:muconate cycloisomerase
MKIQSFEVIPLRLPLKADFKISRGSVASPDEGAPHLMIKLTADDGTIGWGEARPSPRWGGETLESARSSLERYLLPAVIGLDPFNLAEIHRAMDREIAPTTTIAQPVAKSGIDLACHDLICRKLGIGLWRYLGTRDLDGIKISRLVSAPTPAEAEKIAGEAYQMGYRGFKVKTGIRPDHDAEILRAVKSVIGDSILWADANQAYDFPTALSLAKKMEAIGAHVLEQPLPVHRVRELSNLADAVDIPIALDESVFTPGDLMEALRNWSVDAVVIKVCKSGGLWNARRMVEIAKEAGVMLLGSGLTETRFGLTASAQLYAALGIKIPVDLNGPQFLADDILPGSLSEITEVNLSDSPGIAPEPDLEKLERYRIDR